MLLPFYLFCSDYKDFLDASPYTSLEILEAAEGLRAEVAQILPRRQAVPRG